MVRASSPAKLRPWSGLIAKMVMGVVPGLVKQEFLWLEGKCLPFPREGKFISSDTEYDRAKVPPYNGHDPLPSPGSLKAFLFPPL